MFGLPNARINRTTQSTASLIADVDGELELKPTACGPSLALIASSRSAMVSSAWSQVICSQPGSAASLGLVRRSGCSSRPECSMICGAALPFTHSALPVGWEGSGWRLSSLPSSTLARAPHRETHSGQYVGIRSPAICRSCQKFVAAG